jgi:hypothetical protein
VIYSAQLKVGGEEGVNPSLSRNGISPVTQSE